jgi:hypothetical protein
MITLEVLEEAEAKKGIRDLTAIWIEVGFVAWVW